MKDCGIDMSTLIFAEPTVNIVDLVEDLNEFAKYCQTGDEKVLEFRDDPLTLSCASYRAYVNNPNDRWHDLDAVVVEPADREQAAAIRQYYGTKLVMAALMGQKLTEFRAKMGQFLAGEHQLRRNELGMLYKIPYFYTEDTAVDRVIAETVSAQEVHEVTHRLQLTHLATILQTRKSGDIKQYWFVDDQRQAYMSSGPANTPLTSLVESVFARGNIDVIARVFRKAHYGTDRGQHYYMMSQLELV
jgi:hypothetical protein